MCSLNDEDGGDMLMKSKEPLILRDRVCRSCDEQAQVVLRKKDLYCGSCFLNSLTHKFRATLGKSKMMKAGDRVLVIFTGNHSSVALLHFLRCGLNENKNKRLIFNVDILYVEDGLILGDDLEKRKSVVDNVICVVKQLDFDIFFTTLSEIFSDVPKVERHLIVNECHEEKLKQLFEGVKTITAKEDLLFQLRQKLVSSVASNLEYNKIFSSESGTELAIKLLVGISLGRGDQMSAAVGFCDSRNSRIPILRPLKDFTQKEIVFYNIFQSVRTICLPTLTTKASSTVSIQKITENFVNSLQEEFPSTVYTIFRTGDKLNDDIVSIVKDGFCALCRGVVKSSSADKYCGDNFQFTESIDKLGRTDSVNHCQVNGNSCTACSSRPEHKQEEIRKNFCYGCSLIFRDMDKKEDFQEHIINLSMKEKNLQNLRNQISEFLID